jgi:hypothetical protein
MGATGRRYELQDGYYAVHGRRQEAPAEDAVLVLNEGEIAVFRGPSPPTPRVGPVYAAPNGPLAVPTGLIFVRFTEGTSAAERRAELERLGFELVQVPAYARHAAWVRPQYGDIAAALTRTADLAALPGVDSVEPQMLMAVAHR